MSKLIIGCINECITSIKINKQTAEEYSGSDHTVSRIISHDARASIRQTQEEIDVFALMLVNPSHFVEITLNKKNQNGTS